ncbi:MAG TPA: polyprenyl synthetase family protein [Abditibacteriaceae bacterium]
MIARLDEFRATFQPHLDSFVQSRLDVCAPLCDDAFLHDVLSYLAAIGQGTGKRIRPYVAWLAFDALAGDNARINEALVALELFHLFCLVHDDVIDHGTQRYGIPTIQHYVASRMNDDATHAGHLPSRASHVGNAHALLLGDLLFAWAHQSFDLDDFPASARSRARGFFRSMIDEVLVGQMIDVDMTARRATSLETIRRKLVLKTASYTFIRPMQIGAALAGDGEFENYFYDLGLALGLAFQLQDDWLDISGAPQNTQKTFLSDVREGQHTYFTQYVFECGTPSQHDELRALLGAELGEADRARVGEFFARTGALAHGKQEIERHLEQARALLENGPLPAAHRDAFLSLIGSLQRRFDMAQVVA